MTPENWQDQTALHQSGVMHIFYIIIHFSDNIFIWFDDNRSIIVQICSDIEAAMSTSPLSKPINADLNNKTPYKISNKNDFLISKNSQDFSYHTFIHSSYDDCENMCTKYLIIIIKSEV